jgi:hypothetical protein
MVGTCLSSACHSCVPCSQSALSVHCRVIKHVRYIEAILQQECDTAEREQREIVAAVQRQVQKQASDKAMCLPDNHCESMELCDMSKILQMFAEYTEGGKANMHATGFADAATSTIVCLT